MYHVCILRDNKMGRNHFPSKFSWNKISAPRCCKIVLHSLNDWGVEIYFFFVVFNNRTKISFFNTI